MHTFVILPCRTTWPLWPDIWFLYLNSSFVQRKRRAKINDLFNSILWTFRSFCEQVAQFLLLLMAISLNKCSNLNRFHWQMWRIPICCRRCKFAKHMASLGFIFNFVDKTWVVLLQNYVCIICCLSRVCETRLSYWIAQTIILSFRKFEHSQKRFARFEGIHPCSQVWTGGGSFVVTTKNFSSTWTGALCVLSSNNSAMQCLGETVWQESSFKWIHTLAPNIGLMKPNIEKERHLLALQIKQGHLFGERNWSHQRLNPDIFQTKTPLSKSLRKFPPTSTIRSNHGPIVRVFFLNFFWCKIPRPDEVTSTVVDYCRQMETQKLVWFFRQCHHFPSQCWWKTWGIGNHGIYCAK